jgi:hemoglobin-like flavoprotein
MHKTKVTFLNSLGRCEDTPGFIRSFYDRFIGSSELVRRKFHDTDMEAQAKVLLHIIHEVASATEGSTSSLKELAYRAETHSRRHMNITPDLYELWRTALIETAHEFDPKWDGEIEEAWILTLDTLIYHMLKKY